MFEYTVRNLVEQSNKNLTWSLEDEEKLVKYYCLLNPEEKMDIKKLLLISILISVLLMIYK